jgi:elongation factor G
MANDLHKVRNFGIVAHVDAGKTTTSERILFYTGMSHKIGEVHDGATVTDWMEQERERGITITAAAITCFWTPTYDRLDANNTAQAAKETDPTRIRFNIIDTPGHIDFTSEVQRSMRVLDGAVVVFDGVAGVEPQSETNWRYAEDAHVPRLCYINKLDRTGANFEKSFASIRARLSKNAYRLQVPIGAEDNFEGMVDVLTRKRYSFGGAMGMEVTITDDIPEDLKADVEKYRAEIVEKIVEQDETVMNAYLEGTEPDVATLKKLLRKAVIANEIFPVYCGSSLKNKGVQPVLDGVVDYLPSPLDVPPAHGTNPDNGEDMYRKADDAEPFAALVFKLQTDPFVGQLSFFRVYSGVVKAGDTVLNASTGNKERIGRMVRLQADKREEIKEVHAGEIAAAVGMKEAKIGQTLCAVESPIELEKIVFRQPVISMRIEPKTKADQEKMGIALSKLSDEDPTFRVSTDPDTLETIISGMGELHLEILVDRMKREFKVEAATGKPQVAYRETIQGTAEAENKYIKQTGGKGQYGHTKIRIKPMEPLPEDEKERTKYLKTVDREDHFEFINSIKGGVIPGEFIPAVRKGIKEALERGISAGYPVVDVSVELYDGSFHEVDSSEIAFKISGSQAFQDAAKRAKPVILEPVMKVEVVTPEEFMGDVNGSINSKRGMVESMDERGGARVVTAKVPLSELFGYTTDLRSMSQGRASATIEFSHYAVVPKNVADEIISSRS